VGGLAVLLRSAIYGTTAILHAGFDAARVRDSLEAGEITLASFVPTMLARLREAGLGRAPGLRAALLGGGPIPVELLDWALGAGLPVCPTYGMTETASQIVTAPPGERSGRPLPGVELRIGEGGEILVRGPMVARGALAADGWLHTGDSGRLDETGRLHVEGRLKEIIVTGGENVAPAEVEEALVGHPAVVDAGVTGLADPEWGEAITAYVVLAGEVSPAALRDWTRGRLAPYKVPKRIVIVP
jgi:o-succinylbenzoate---CoA ligase